MPRPRPLLPIAGLALALAATAGTARAQLDSRFDPRHLTTPPLRRIETVTPQRLVLANGIVVFLLENHDLPVVTGEVDVRSTPSWIPDGRVGLGAITGEVMRSGGSAAHGGDWLDDRLAAIGASIDTRIGADLATASFRCLSDNTTEVVGLFAEVLGSPAFPDDKIELARVGERRAIAARNDEMLPMLVRVATEAVYGRGSPYARKPEYATIEAVRREDCARLHDQVFDPRRIVLAVYGDFKSAEMKKLLASKLGAWKAPGGPAPVLPPSPPPGSARLVFAPKEDVTQSGIVLAELGFRADDPDYPAMDVFQTALGGGFQSRLVNRIRTARGLAYGTGAQAGEGYQRPGVFFAYCLTRGDSTLTALDLLRSEVRKSTEAPFTDEELQRAKESVQNQFVFNFERPSNVLFRAAFFEAVGYPQDFLERYQKGLEGVTAGSVLEAARRKVHPDQLVAVVVGKEKDFDRPLTAAELPVERVDITIPPPPSKLAVGQASPEAGAKGRAWLERAAQLAGGSASWAAIRSASLEQDQQISAQGQSFAVKSVVSWVLPDRRAVVLTGPMGVVRQVAEGGGGWVAMGNQAQDQPTLADGLKQDYERSLYHLFGHPDEVAIQALPDPMNVDGVQYDVAFVKSDVVQDWTIAFAPDGRIARMEFQGRGPAGPAKATQTFGDWRAVGSVQYPHAATLLLDGKPYFDAKVTAARFNVAIPDSVFKKPSP
ncbi:MAG TPA: pitrilysin family protein [Candidatus Eisenbacteria bacterium]